MGWRVCISILALLWAEWAWAAAYKVDGMRVWPSPQRTRIVFDLSGPAGHHLFQLTQPDRLVVDLKQVTFSASTRQIAKDSRLIKAVRTGAQGKDGVRVVFDLAAPVRPQSFLLKPNKSYGHRLVVDLYDFAEAESSPQATKSQQQLAHGQGRDIVIALDAGHGGDDPGALGPKGTLEKDIVLAIATQLKWQIDKQPGMRAVMVREGDYYIGLRRRTAIARQQRADLFISIHADAFRDARAKGASVYALSQRGASSENARWLADKENTSDLIGGVGGVSLDDKDDLLASVLLDLSTSATISSSLDVGGNILSRMGSVAKLHKKRVEQAGFVVLKSPDMPSILVETGFISNPDEERKLSSRAYRKKMATAIFRGLKAHFQQYPPEGSHWYIAKHNRQQQYKVVRGDTLSGIASKHGVSLSSLRRQNNLRGDLVRIGQVLTIPAGG